MWIKYKHAEDVDPKEADKVIIELLPCEGSYQCRQFMNCKTGPNASGLPAPHLDLTPSCLEGTVSGSACRNQQMNAGEWLRFH